MIVKNRTWHWIEWMLFIVYTLWFLLGLTYVIFKPEELFKSSSPAMAPLIMIAGYFLPLLFWRPGYVNAMLFPIAIFLTWGGMQLYVTSVAQQNSGIILVPILLAGFLSQKKTFPFTIPLFVAFFPVASAFLLKDFSVISMLERVIQFAMFFGIGVALRQMVRANMKMRKILDENESLYNLIREQNKVLEQYASQVEHITLLEERNRMAVELHDTVGHTFTSVIMGMDAVSYLIEAAPDKAKAKLDVLREVTRKGLDEIRTSIHQISPNEETGLEESLSKLAEEFAAHTGTQLKFKTFGTCPEVPKQTSLTLYRCLQESLTNAKRHGMAKNIEVSLMFEPDYLLLQIQDDGTGSGELNRGFGLRGMEQRLAALQGTLKVASQEGQGTIVVCKVPYIKNN